MTGIMCTHHCESVKLPKGCHRLQHEDNDPSTFYGLDRSGEEIGRNRLKILEYTHSISVAENFVRLLVISKRNRLMSTK